MDRSERKIYIRADGNGKIGMGHLMRCLSAALELRAADGDVCFLVAEDRIAMIIREAGFSCVALGTDYRQMETELPILEEVILHHNICETARSYPCEEAGRPERETVFTPAEVLSGDEKCLFLVDSYYVTETYLRTLRKWGKVAYIDDVNAFPYPADIIINGNIYGADMDYSACGEQTEVMAHTEVLGGVAYAPLRPEFARHRGERREEHILVTTGGSDPYRLSAKIVGSLLKEPWMEREKICAVCGRFSRSMEALREMERQDPRLRVLSNVPDMWSVMNKAKFAVTAAGSTMQELACLGVPMIGFSFADNQRLAARTWFEQGYSCYGGDYLSLGDAMIPEICAAAETLCGNFELRNQYSRKLMELVDGMGSRRIAERLLNLQNNM